jgi:hypothetical protein
MSAGNHLTAMHNTRTQFKPGHTPWNAGLKGFQSGGRSALTHFAKGEQPHNTMCLGSYRIITSKAGLRQLERKMSDTPGPNHRRWVPVARLVWEAVHGTVAKGSFVVFKAGQRSCVLEDITIDRLQCLTRAQNAQLNHPRSKSVEIAKLCQLKGVITRQVNRIAREHANKNPKHTQGAQA